MNFFKSVFSSDPDRSDASSDEEPPSAAPHSRPDDEKGEIETTAVTVADSEPRDYSNLKQNTPCPVWKRERGAIREVAARAVRDLPSSLEVGASVAQESLESVGQAIDDFGGSVWRGTAEIISEGKDALLSADSDAETHSSDLQNPASAAVAASASKRYSRFEAQVLAMQSDPNTFSEEPEDAEDFLKWMSEFKLEGKEEEIETLCYDNGTLEDLFEKLVPSVLDYDTFWTRYFYKFYKLKQAEDVRANFVKRAILREDEEDLTWEVDDDDAEGKEEELAEKDGEDERNEEIKEDDKAKTVDGESSQVEHAVERKEKVDTDGIQFAQEKKPDAVPEDLILKFTTATDNEIAAPSVGAVDDAEPASKGLTTKSADKVLPYEKSEPAGSCKDSDISIVSSQTSMPEEEDLGWDEIEDLGEHDEKKVGRTSSTTNRVDLHKRLEEVEDLTWDIEDDD
ncbi:BSD domain-containing protein C22A12.14c [Phalaenopsis equestris]|uniref:BSD domain-containing protein C22A12.14c n=1 Tax=Phalaenopsis equestris TaxID=78828 RepID=UPI0009E56044|nr:BSD domain-containing protein C22A12.14c [Phalaenopsis equestris]